MIICLGRFQQLCSYQCLDLGQLDRVGAEVASDCLSLPHSSHVSIVDCYCRLPRYASPLLLPVDLLEHCSGLWVTLIFYLTYWELDLNAQCMNVGRSGVGERMC